LERPSRTVEQLAWHGYTAAGALSGGVAGAGTGAVIGGGVGALASAPTFGTASVVTVPAGGGIGGIIGGVVGVGGGGSLDMRLDKPSAAVVLEMAEAVETPEAEVRGRARLAGRLPSVTVRATCREWTSQGTVESAINNDIQQGTANASSTGRFWGHVNVDGQTVY